jgi:tRNA nucleotidyltransferase (CCA-adding enzyme)
MMARTGHAYPQVDTRAAALIDRRVVAVPSRLSIAEALTLARRKRAEALVVPDRPGLVLRVDLQRAARLGLQALRAADLARSVPAVSSGDSEIAVRRHLLAGAPAVLVLERNSPIGAIGPLARSDRVRSALTSRQLAWIGGPVLALLGEIARVAAETCLQAFVVGGLVRDALLAASGSGLPAAPHAHDVDVVVEGDGIGVAERLARRLGGRVRTHAVFGTASIEGLATGHLDIATARAERYRLPGALPDVRAGTIVEDLERRDFSVNAIAVELSSGAFELLDPFGGRRDLARRRLRVLHPLAFVEDPTRIFRAARYASRLGFALDRATMRARALAVHLERYPALSGQRLAAELRRVVGDAAPDLSLGRLAAAGAFRLLDSRLRFAGRSAGAIRGVAETLAWIEPRRVAADPLEVALLAVLAAAPIAVGATALTRLGMSGAPRARVLRALAEAPDLARELDSLALRSGVAARLRGLSALELAEAWRRGTPRTRERLDWWVAEGSRVESALHGADLVRLGLAPGPAVGSARARLRDARLDGAVSTRDDEVALVRQWRAAREPQRSRSEVGRPG